MIELPSEDYVINTYINVRWDHWLLRFKVLDGTIYRILLYKDSRLIEEVEKWSDDWDRAIEWLRGING